MEFDIQADKKSFIMLLAKLTLDEKQVKRIRMAGCREAANFVKKKMKAASPKDTGLLKKSWHSSIKHNRKTQKVTTKVRPNPKKKYPLKGMYPREPSYTSHFVDKGFKHWKAKKFIKGRGDFDSVFKKCLPHVNTEMRKGRLKAIKKEFER